jgi:hypothetical protein
MCERAIPVPDPAWATEHATSSGQFRPADADALAELQFHWGSAYHLAVVKGAWTARRKDGQGGTLTDPVPEGLRLLIRADYAAIPVPRNLP